MKDYQKPVPSRYLAAFAITTLIFLVGILIGNKISDAKLDSIDVLEKEIRIDVLGTELQYQLISENPCNLSNPAQLTEELYDIGSKLDFMENQRGKNDPQVLDLKKYYSMLEVQHWLLLKKTKERCGEEYNLILYFYSNLGDCDACDQQGHVLNYIHEKYPEVNIYSFDINIDNPVLRTIKELYEIRQPPTLIINDDAFTGFMDSREVEGQLVFA